MPKGFGPKALLRSPASSANRSAVSQHMAATGRQPERFFSSPCSASLQVRRQRARPAVRPAVAGLDDDKVGGARASGSSSRCVGPVAVHERLRRAARRRAATRGTTSSRRGRRSPSPPRRGRSSSGRRRRRAGCMLYLYGDSGTTYEYIHLNNDLGTANDNKGKCVPGMSYAPGLKDGQRGRGRPARSGSWATRATRTGSTRTCTSRCIRATAAPPVRSRR